MNILITGITGFIGKNFHKYSRYKNDIVAISRKNSIQKYNQFNTLNFLDCDLSSINNFSNQIIDFNPEYLINMAWGGIPDYSEENSNNNLEMTLKFFDFITKHTKVKKIINTGTCAEYYNPIGKISENYIVKPYDNFSASKINLSEILFNKCSNLNINYINLRLFYVYGLYQRKESLIPHIINSYKKGLIPKISNPFTKLDYIFTEDVVEAIDSCIEHEVPSGSYNVGSGESVYNSEIQKLISEKFDHKFDNLTKSKEEINFYADISKLNRFTNWTPKFNIYRGVEKIIDDIQ